jgi:hypothetical protein
MKKIIVAALGLIAFQTSAFASHLPACLVHPSGGNPVVYAGETRVEKVWDLEAAHLLVEDLKAAGVCEIDAAYLPTCAVVPNQSLWSVYSGADFWQNFASDDLQGAADFADELRAYQFCL